MRRVIFLSDSPRFNLRPAKRFGKPEFLFIHEPNATKVEYSAYRLLDALRRVKFDPAKDFVALTGTPGLLCLLTAVVVANYEDVRVLAYKPKDSTYTACRLEVTDERLDDKATGGVARNAAAPRQDDDVDGAADGAREG